LGRPRLGEEVSVFLDGDFFVGSTTLFFGRRPRFFGGTFSVSDSSDFAEISSSSDSNDIFFFAFDLTDFFLLDLDAGRGEEVFDLFGRPLFFCGVPGSLILF